MDNTSFAGFIVESSLIKCLRSNLNVLSFYNSAYKAFCCIQRFTQANTSSSTKSIRFIYAH